MSGEVIGFNSDSGAVLSWESEGGRLAPSIPDLLKANQKNGDLNKMPDCFVKLRNDNGIAEIQIGMREIICIGASPPHDHPHVYLNMGLSEAMMCPYCATSFCFTPMLAPDGVTPIDCIFR